MQKPLVYVLEDDENINELISYALSSNDIEVKSFLNAKELFLELEDKIPEILVLDIMLPDANGYEIIKKLKASNETKDIEILLLSALNSELNKVKGLDLGASDYLSKPFSMMEFLARIRVLLRRTVKENKIKIKDLKIDLDSRNVSIKDVQINLTLKEFELLITLIKSPNYCFKKDELLELIWGASFSSRTLDIHINTLRTKLKDYASLIKTVHGVGYKVEI